MYASYDTVNNTSSLNLKNVLFVIWGVMLLGWASGCLGSEDSTDHSFSSPASNQQPSAETSGPQTKEHFSFFYDSISAPARALMGDFLKAPAAKRLSQVSERDWSIPRVRLNKTVKSTGLHFSQGSLRRLRSSRATGPYLLHVVSTWCRIPYSRRRDQKTPREVSFLWSASGNLCFCPLFKILPSV